jgi:hypothetical protein
MLVRVRLSMSGPHRMSRLRDTCRRSRPIVPLPRWGTDGVGCYSGWAAQRWRGSGMSCSVCSSWKCGKRRQPPPVYDGCRLTRSFASPLKHPRVFERPTPQYLSWRTAPRRPQSRSRRPAPACGVGSRGHCPDRGSRSGLCLDGGSRPLGWPVSYDPFGAALSAVSTPTPQSALEHQVCAFGAYLLASSGTEA